MRILLSILFVFNQVGAWAQVEMQKITPLSPNAASIMKYVDMPVGEFTGIPAIGMPIFTVEANGISLPVGLSYHAGGNKVETISSFVGLGWSITGIPTISRGVRGIADEKTGGYLHKYNGKTVKELWDGQFAAGLNDWQEFLRAAEEGIADPEADVFQFNLGGKSGKFFYDQQNDRFLTYPFENLKISCIPSGDIITFTIVDDKGNQYHFTERETSTSWENFWGTQRQETVTTSWYCQKIVNANKTDSILFSYSAHETLLLNQRSASKFFPTSQTSCPTGQLDYQESVRNYENVALNIYQIIFKKGRIEFNSSDITRLDLAGAYSLDTLLVFNHRDEKIKQLNFHYGYIQSQNDCNQFDTTDNRWMYLQSVEEVDTKNGRVLPYSYTYDFSAIPPCRTSPAQDFWGYYNGETSNPHLVPSTYINNPGSGVPQFIEGADRYVSPLAAQFGILKKISYPTGGYTEYKFESNTAGNVTSSKKPTKTKTAFIDGEETPTTSHYVTYFTIDNPPDPVLNNNNNNGGAMVKVVAGGFGCDLTGGSHPCANVRLVGVGSSFHAPISGTPNNNSYNQTFYLANGEYKLEATFSQDPPAYNSFYFMASWEVLDSSQNLFNQYAGGLRISEILAHDGISNTNNLVKKFRYTTSLESDSTSGKLLGANTFNFVDNYTRHQWYVPQEAPLHYLDCISTHKRIKAYSNTQFVSYSGSFIGYSKVITESIGQHKNGLVVQEFSNLQDQVKTSAPYTPYETYEHLRGLPIKTTTYGIKDTIYYPVSMVVNEYAEADTVAWAWGVKIGDELSYIYDRNNPAKTVIAQAVQEFPQAEEYQTLSQASRLIRKIERTFQGPDFTSFLETITEYEYNPVLLLAEEKITNSIQQEKTTKYYYPGDITLTGEAETGRQELMARNMISAPLKTQKYTDNTLLETTQVNFRKDPVYDHVLPKEILHGKGTIAGNPVIEISFLKYDQHANLLAQQKNNDIVHSYVWDYGAMYPIAEAANAEPTAIAFTSFEADGGGGWDVDGGAIIVQDGFTGKKALNGGVAKTVTAGNYWVGVWGTGNTWINGQLQSQQPAKTVGAWKYFESLLLNVTNVTVSGDKIDELRLFPEKAQMTAYTFNPLVGVTSQTDANNRVTYYEYDGFNRLLRIMDEDKNILKQYDYQYNVFPHANAIWQTTGTTRCKPCPENVSYTMNVRQNEERDANPNSATYNQVRWVDAGIQSSCASAGWQNTTTTVRCRQVDFANTGEQEQEQRDMNPCSGTYNQTRWVVTGTNTSTCPLPTYAKLTYENYNYNFENIVYADVVVQFYADAACTQPKSVADLDINIAMEGYNNLTGYFNSDFSQTAGGTYHTVAYQVELSFDDGVYFRFKDYYLMEGSGYIVAF